MNIELYNPTPIEEKMALGIARNWISQIEWTDSGTLDEFRARIKASTSKTVFYVAHQVEVEPYRVDFLVGACDWDFGRPVVFAIECDGHAFHEKTKEQAAHDKRRDRYLAAQGVETLRFTGSEIWSDARKCGNEITLLLLRRVSEMSEEMAAKMSEARHVQS